MCCRKESPNHSLFAKTNSRMRRWRLEMHLNCLVHLTPRIDKVFRCIGSLGRKCNFHRSNFGCRSVSSGRTLCLELEHYCLDRDSICCLCFVSRVGQQWIWRSAISSCRILLVVCSHQNNAFLIVFVVVKTKASLDHPKRIYSKVG